MWLEAFIRITITIMIMDHEYLGYMYVFHVQA